MEESGKQLIQGRLLNLEARFTGSRIWLGPAWALLCGAVASGGLSVSWQSLISLLLGLLLVDSLLGTVWSVATSDLSTVRVPKGGNPTGESQPVALPYTLPGSFSHRFFDFLGRRIAHWRSTVWPQVGASLLSLSFGCVAAVVVAAALGAVPLLLTGLALVLAALRFAVSPSREGVHLAMRSVFSAGLAWLIGYTTFWDVGALGADRAVLARPLIWAAVYAMVFHGYQWLSRGDLARGARAVSFTQMAAVAVLIIVKQPILAGVVALLLLPQMLLQPSLLKTGDGPRYMRSVQVFTMAAMMVTAVAAVT